MARPLRLNVPGGLYHVTARGVDRCPIFKDDHDRQLFLRLLAETVTRFGWLLHAFSLMLTHFHLMPETPRGNLSAGMAWLKGMYASKFNARHGRVGHLFDNRFKSRLIQSARYGRNAHHYIHRNSLEAGLVGEPWIDPWNSSRYFLGLETPPRWLNTDWMLNQYESIDDYREELMRGAVDPADLSIGEAILGERDFAADFITEQVLGNPDISGRLDLGRFWTVDEILAALTAEGGAVVGLSDRRRGQQDARGLLMFLLRELGGIPIAEVAAQAGVTKGAVSQRVSAIRARAAQDAMLGNLIQRVAARLGRAAN